jgi:GNAT superfamily N-acetyltransferase
MREVASGINVRVFERADQDAARRLILEGLAAHFGFLDETLNRDLDDIAATFADGIFVVATIDAGGGGRRVIAGTGGLHVQPDGTANVVRMSTSAQHRRLGIGRAVLHRLIDEARARRCHRITLATNADWDDAIGLYHAAGFDELLRSETGVVFAMPL